MGTTIGNLSGPVESAFPVPYIFLAKNFKLFRWFRYLKIEDPPIIQKDKNGTATFDSVLRPSLTFPGGARVTK